MLDAEINKALETFQNACNRRMAESNAGDEPREPLFHYTNEAALHSIVASDQFWFTSIYHMDDPEELTFGFNLARTMFEEALSRNGLTRSFCQGVLEGDDLERIKKLIAFYSVSFGLRDDPRQWESYADSSRGVALGLAADFFRPHPFDDPGNPRPDEQIFYGKVFYGDAAGRARHSKVTESAFTLLEQMEAAGKLKTREDAAEFCRQLASSMYTEVLWNAVTTKDSTWEHQNEMRILARNFLKKPHLPIVNADIRPCDEIVQPRLKASIAEVMVGP